MTFTLQEQLALMMTAAGTQRRLAGWLGITHQQVGRWLKEGEPGGVKQIPARAAAPIAFFFPEYVSIVKAICRRQGIPFLANVPIYMERQYLKSIRDAYGAPILGDRAFSGNTEHIRERLRRTWITAVVRSEKFHKVNVQSIVDLKLYFQAAAAEDIRVRKRIDTTVDQLADYIEEGFIEAESRRKGLDVDDGEIIDATIPYPFFTRNIVTVPGSVARQVADGVENYLREKHSPATGVPGTHFANKYLLQILPKNYVDKPQRRYAGRRNTRGRGPK